MISGCYNCKFYIKSEEKFCPECGVSAPNQPLTFDSDNYDRPLSIKTIVFCMLMIFTSLMILHLFKDNDNFNEARKWIALSLLPVVVFILFVGPAILHYLGRKEKRNRRSQTQSPTNFRFIEEEILMRDRELKEKLRNLKKSARRGKRRSKSITQSKAAQKEAEVQHLRTQYDLLWNKIQFARLQNNLLSIIEQRKELKIEGDIFEEIDEILSEIKTVKLSLTDEQNDKSSEQFPDDDREFLLQVTETEKLCKALLNSKSEVEPYQNNFEISSSRDFAYQTNKLNVQVTLKNVIATFNELGHTYQRLKIEQQ